MLAHDLVHADLSAHNILYWEGAVKIIDFPQAVARLAEPGGVQICSCAMSGGLCQYFARYGVAADPLQIATDFWTRYVLITNDISADEA